MSNSVMERIVEQRHNLRLPAKAIQWGAVGEVGLVADMQEDKIDLEIGGTLQQRISSCLEELDVLMTCDQPIVSSMVVAEKRYSEGKKNIFDAIMNIMSIRDAKSLSMESTLSDIGMDSMMTVEIQQVLEREHDVVLSAQELRSMKLRDLLNLANNQALSSETPVEKGFVRIMRDLGNEATSKERILKLETASESGKKILLVPGEFEKY